MVAAGAARDAVAEVAGLEGVFDVAAAAGRDAVEADVEADFDFEADTNVLEGRDTILICLQANRSGIEVVDAMLAECGRDCTVRERQW